MTRRPGGPNVVSDRHIRILRQAAKAARVRLAAFLENAQGADTADAEARHKRTASVLRRRAASTETRLRDAEQRRDPGHATRDAADPPDATPAEPSPSPHPLERGSDGVLRLPPR